MNELGLLAHSLSATATAEPALHRAAVELEAAFLAEMLKHAGLGEAGDSFGGGAGEEAFASFAVAEQARILAENGGIGLAEHLFRALAREADNK
jgi:Rod binding domain-containing protein